MIPLAEYYSQLFERAMGWLGYTPDEARRSNVNDLLLALRGRVELLRLIFGAPTRSPSPATPHRPLTAAAFDAVFGSLPPRARRK